MNGTRTHQEAFTVLLETVALRTVATGHMRAGGSNFACEGGCCTLHCCHNCSLSDLEG